jgi:predicted Rossmann fold nucleotide-binding protein DprA/Smf involved in DNA uptake
MSTPPWMTPPPDFGPLFGAETAESQGPDLGPENDVKILDALLLGPAGAEGVAKRCGLDVGPVSRRMCELERRGLVVRDGVVRGMDRKSEVRYRAAR